MQKYISIIASILILSNGVVATALWGQLSYDAIQGYRSPLRGVNLLAQPPLLPFSEKTGNKSKIVMVLISGLGYETSLELKLPVFERLKQAGATMSVESYPPTYSQTAWATLVTGASPEMNDASPVDKPLTDLYPLQVDTIFSRAHEANLQTALLGTTAWRELIPAQTLDYSLFVESTDPLADQTVAETAISIIENKNYDFILLQFTQLNQIAQTEGKAVSSNEAYQQSAQQIDAYLEQISQTMDLGHSVLIIASDHGYLADGGYGGAEEQLIWQPFILVGKNIISGEYSDVRQTDIAPTITTLLGIAPPMITQGRVLFELFRLSDDERAATQWVLARQRITLAEAYISVINGKYIPLPATFAADLERAKNSLTNKNINGAFEQTLLIQKQADAAMLTAKNSQMNQARFFRFIFIIIIMIAWPVAMWKLRGPHTSALIIATITVVALYHALYQLQGYSYSISSFKNFAELPLEVSRRTAVSMLTGGGILLIMLLFSDEGKWAILLETGYQFGIVVTFTFALPLFWAFWQNGLFPRWYLPDVLVAFWQMTGLFEVAVAAILGLLIPWPIMSLCVFVTLVRRRLNETQSKEPGTVSGLHFW